MMLRRLVLLLVLLPSLAWAAPPAPEDFAWQPHPGAAIPLDAVFTDTAGSHVTLGSLEGKPLILALGYFSCPTLCGPVRDDLFAALRESGLVGDVDYRLAVISVDKAETVEDARKAKLADLQQTGADGRGWFYLVGDAGPLAASVGFPFRWEPDLQQFAHPAGIVVLTGEGRVSAYLEGVGYSGAALRSAVETAAMGQVAAVPSRLLLLCFHYDASTGRYTLAVYKVLRIMAVMTLLGIGALLILLRRRRRQRVM